MNVLRASAEYWDEAYKQGETTCSWYQEHAASSLRMLDAAGVPASVGLIDVGGGSSRLVDALLNRGHSDVTVLDVSAAALQVAQTRLADAASRVHWIVADLFAWQPTRYYDVWHDRALLHFLTGEDERRRYLEVLDAATSTGAVAVLATFAPDGPQHCSGLPVCRYSIDELAALLGERWTLIHGAREEHTTPTGAVQPFSWAALRRIG